MINCNRMLGVLLCLHLPICASAGDFVVPEDEEFIVNPGEFYPFGKVIVEGTLRNLGGVETAVYTNRGLTENSGFLEIWADLVNEGVFVNTGELITPGLFRNESGAVFTSTRVVFIQDQARNYGTLDLAQLDITGRLDNYGDLVTGSGTDPGAADGVSRVGGVLDNYATWSNSGVVDVGSFAGDFGLVENAGSLTNLDGGEFTVWQGARLDITGTLSNAGDMIVGGDLINHGVINNSGTLQVYNQFSNDPASISGGGDLHNDGQLTVDADAPMTLSGSWVNRGSMLLIVDGLVVDGRLIADSPGSLRVFGGVEITSNGEFRNSDDSITSIDYVMNRGLVHLDSLLSTEGFENHGELILGRNGYLEVFGDLVLYDQATTGLVAGWNNDIEVIGGTMTLGGMLEISLDPNLMLSPEDVLILATAASIDGQFAQVFLPQAPGLNFDLVVSFDGFRQMLALEVSRAVPLPPALLLFMGALGVLSGYRRVQMG